MPFFNNYTQQTSNQLLFLFTTNNIKKNIKEKHIVIKLLHEMVTLKPIIYQGPSINDVTRNWRIFEPSHFIHQKINIFIHNVTNAGPPPPPHKCVTSFMDGPLCESPKKRYEFFFLEFSIKIFIMLFVVNRNSVASLISAIISF